MIDTDSLVLLLKIKISRNINQTDISCYSHLPHFSEACSSSAFLRQAELELINVTVAVYLYMNEKWATPMQDLPKQRVGGMALAPLAPLFVGFSLSIRSQAHPPAAIPQVWLGGYRLPRSGGVVPWRWEGCCSSSVCLHDASKVFPGLASPGNLLEMHLLQPHPDPLDHRCWGW